MHAGTHLIRHGALVVEVMDPNEPLRYNRGVRFTPVAAVLGAALNGHTFLFNPVTHDPVDDHGGLAAEFDLVTPDDGDAVLPPGYREARVGEGYLKIGVGVLRKERARYSLFQHPALLQPARTTVRWESDAALFSQRCAGTNGYAYALDAAVRLGDASITVEWTLRNTGERPFTTRQYAHNFFRFDNHDVGPGYALSFPYDIQATGLAAEQSQEGRSILFAARIPQWVNLAVAWPDGYSGPNTCHVQYIPTGQAVTCETSRSGLRTAIHARAGYLAPEQFVELRLAAGAVTSWTRRYQFVAGAR